MTLLDKVYYLIMGNYGREGFVSPPVPIPNLSPPESIWRKPPASGQDADNIIGGILGRNAVSIQQQEQQFFSNLADNLNPPVGNDTPWYQVAMMGALGYLAVTMLRGK